MYFKRRPLSLALRLTLLFGVAAAMVFLVFGWIISHSMERHFMAQDTDELKVIARAVQDALDGIHTTEKLAPLEQRFDDILVGHHNASLCVVDQNGRMLYASPVPDLATVAKAASEETETDLGYSWHHDGVRYTVLTRMMEEIGPVAGRPYAVVIAVPFTEHQRFLAVFYRNLWLMVGGSILVMAVMGWIVVRQGHAPLRDIVSRIHRISANELNNRLPRDEVPAELGELVDSFNAMLRRLDESFHQLCDFNADIAHELRTPITNLMTQTQVALSQSRDIDAYREILYSNMEEYERMAQMVGDMLFLAQIDNRAPFKNIGELDLATEVQALFDFYEGWAEERGVALAREGHARIAGDRSMLRRALSNLLSNAIRYTPAGGAVRVTIRARDDGGAALAIENPGTPIPPEHLPRLFDRFYRVDPSRQRGGDGAGLGLAIVKSIITAHGGTVEVTSTTESTRFQIILPERPPHP
ncbi:heavy metal sensor histidine kinase [Thiohalophilus sp.]|uniref:heavy metal sensor histidine kinase n=1 Tax=Thiohalophilus sp. TaxID=3028392 RepID=UPI002ACE4D7D|nr:heavy metal sensor histidine kinase [Thiohalophilus sp.]MDZ7662979.1 heavy metal sensor histidine kinase [Thiohalophilus sp.]